MKIAFFEITEYEKEQFSELLKDHELLFFTDPIQNVDADYYSDVEIICTFIYSKVTAVLLAACENLKGVLTRSTGTDHIDMKHCEDNEIIVRNVPLYGENTVAEHTIALILSISRRIEKSINRIREGEFSTTGLQGFDLKGKTIGLIGCGRIGLHVARMARGFGMNVIVYDVRRDYFMADLIGYTYVTLDRLLKTSHIVSLHAPATPQTFHMINQEAIDKMLDGVVIINTARGNLIDTPALLKGIESGKISGAGLDVIEGESDFIEETLFNSPVQGAARLIKQNQKLMNNENVVITPHNGFNSVEAVNRIIETTVENVGKIESGS